MPQAATADTLLEQATAAASADDHTTALRLLKEAAERFDQRADIAYALGAEYAYLELFDAAEAQMQQALALDAELHAARFHLGLVLVTRSRFEEAMQTWQTLDALPEKHALHCYKKAFDALAEDQFAPARKHIDAGLKASGSNAALDDQMRRLRDSLPAG